jgi:hypothetical protein
MICKLGQDFLPYVHPITVSKIGSTSLGGGYTCVYFDCVVAKIENDPPIPGVSEASMEPGVAMPKKSKNVKLPRKPPGPKSKVLKKAEGDWKDVIKRAVKKKHHAAGWPED